MANSSTKKNNIDIDDDDDIDKDTSPVPQDDDDDDGGASRSSIGGMDSTDIKMTAAAIVSGQKRMSPRNLSYGGSLQKRPRRTKKRDNAETRISKTNEEEDATVAVETAAAAVEEFKSPLRKRKKTSHETELYDYEDDDYDEDDDDEEEDKDKEEEDKVPTPAVAKRPAVPVSTQATLKLPCEQTPGKFMNLPKKKPTMTTRIVQPPPPQQQQEQQQQEGNNQSQVPIPPPMNRLIFNAQQQQQQQPLATSRMMNTTTVAPVSATTRTTITTTTTTTSSSSSSNTTAIPSSPMASISTKTSPPTTSSIIFNSTLFWFLVLLVLQVILLYSQQETQTWLLTTVVDTSKDLYDQYQSMALIAMTAFPFLHAVQPDREIVYQYYQQQQFEKESLWNKKRQTLLHKIQMQILHNLQQDYQKTQNEIQNYQTQLQNQTFPMLQKKIHALETEYHHVYTVLDHRQQGLIHKLETLTNLTHQQLHPLRLFLEHPNTDPTTTDWREWEHSLEITQKKLQNYYEGIEQSKSSKSTKEYKLKLIDFVSLLTPTMTTTTIEQKEWVTLENYFSNHGIPDFHPVTDCSLSLPLLTIEQEEKEEEMTTPLEWNIPKIQDQLLGVLSSLIVHHANTTPMIAKEILLSKSTEGSTNSTPTSSLASLLQLSFITQESLEKTMTQDLPQISVLASQDMKRHLTNDLKQWIQTTALAHYSTPESLLDDNDKEKTTVVVGNDDKDSISQQQEEEEQRQLVQKIQQEILRQLETQPPVLSKEQFTPTEDPYHQLITTYHKMLEDLIRKQQKQQPLSLQEQVDGDDTMTTTTEKDTTQFLTLSEIRALIQEYIVEVDITGDQTGKIDYASLANGARILKSTQSFPTMTSHNSIRDNIPIGNEILSKLYGIRFYGYGPEAALLPTILTTTNRRTNGLGQCWSFYNDQHVLSQHEKEILQTTKEIRQRHRGMYSTLTLSLAKSIYITSIRIEHPMNAPKKSAIRSFRIIGYESAHPLLTVGGGGEEEEGLLSSSVSSKRRTNEASSRMQQPSSSWSLGFFEYQIHGPKATSIQEFKVSKFVNGEKVPKLQSITLAIDSTWGDTTTTNNHPEKYSSYACLYRFRVHGSEDDNDDDDDDDTKKHTTP